MLIKNIANILGKGIRKATAIAYNAALVPPVLTSALINRIPYVISKHIGNGRFANIANKLLLNNVSRIGTLGLLATSIPAEVITKGLVKTKIWNKKPDFDERLSKFRARMWRTLKDPSIDILRPL